ncbi:P-loop containing nucleoside triphosphate hydrolase protein [Lentinula aciculospora]|uniref:P-loop containing nucleoside triphosphate hydrolase protein n=1 Tax=Lentinula aciculospora TaxID=153920 RepID=A0A9W9A7A5_9AGAR|nr:P-loop containing nucleoside triphosphate hydrolase protein [Lentinula aciculospora]
MTTLNTHSATSNRHKKSNRSGRTEIQRLQLGVYQVMIEKRISSVFTFDVAETVEAWRAGLQVLKRLVLDVTRIAPLMLFIMAFSKIWESLEEVVLLGLETRLLRIIEIGLSSADGMMARALIMTVITRVLFAMCSSLIHHWSRDTESRAKSRVLHYYDDFLLIARLRMDIPAIQDNRSDDHLNSLVPWTTFTVLLELSTKLLAVASQLGFMFHIVQSGHGVIFATLCIMKPLIGALSRKNMWSMRMQKILLSSSLTDHLREGRVVEATNTDFLRMRSLRTLESEEFRSDILSGDLVQYIIKEFRNARKNLGETETESPEMQYYNKHSSTASLIASFVGDFPLIYYVAVALIKPSSMNLSTIASLQQSAILLRWLFWDIFYHADTLRQYISRLQHLYDLEKATPTIKDGDISYPPEKHSDKGMSLELNHVSFSYPGSKEDTKALSNVSFRIEPGELVVIVGANGSGKSTFVKLLTRLYDVDDGTVLIDGEDIRRFKLPDIRKAIATLTQEHLLFPLSIAENIGLGCPDAMTDMDLVNKAAQMGGAKEIMNKLGNGVKTILDPFSIQYGSRVEENEQTELSEALKQLKKKVEVSGGERQRLVASRTFMRFNSESIRFVAVDEPSSALDPEGELQLFDNLREAKAGKTMVFVTHRFGHLTKYADKILCMKEGEVAEHGSHAELLAKKGEYFKMYNIQAKAFETVPLS